MPHDDHHHHAKHHHPREPEPRTLRFLQDALDPLAGKRLLDVGCGAGALADMLGPLGANVTGVDPNEEALAAARERFPGAAFVRADAERLPFGDGAFDAAVFLNSLHHVPAPGMDAALLEAARVVVAGGPIVVVEPLAEGSFFLALMPLEDEVEAREAAQRCLRRAVDGGGFRLAASAEYVRRERFRSAEEFVGHAVAVDPAARGEAAERRREEVESAIQRHAGRDEEGYIILEQPLRAVALTASGDL